MPQFKPVNGRIALCLIPCLVFSGCIRYRPHPAEQASFMERAETKTQDNVTVTVTVLSDKEAKTVFGKDLAKKGIQPVWIKIDNHDDIPYVFIPRNTDPDYYSAEEAAYISHYRQGKQFFEAGIIGIIFFPALALIPFNYFAIRQANKKMDSVFNQLSLRSYLIMPHEKLSGFVFTSVDQGTKHVKIYLACAEEDKVFDFVAKVPGIKPDYTTKDIEKRYPREAIVDCTDEELPELLKKLPCCVTDKKGKKYGDPLNLVVIAEFEELVPLFTSIRWNETQALTFKSGFEMAKAFLTGEHDRYSPISPLYFDGHPQDIAFQKTRDNINQRLHFRLWYTPIRYKSKPVWVGAISRDIGIKFTFKTWYLTTHKIDPNLDDSRDYLFTDIAQVGKVSRYGFIDNTALISSTHPKKNLTNDPYFTDNKRVVIELSEVDTELRAFPWSSFLDNKPLKKE